MIFIKQSLTQSLTHPPTHPLIYSLTQSLIHSLTHSLILMLRKHQNYSFLQIIIQLKCDINECMIFTISVYGSSDMIICTLWLLNSYTNILLFLETVREAGILWIKLNSPLCVLPQLYQQQPVTTPFCNIDAVWFLHLTTVFRCFGKVTFPMVKWIIANQHKMLTYVISFKKQCHALIF